MNSNDIALIEFRDPPPPWVWVEILKVILGTLDTRTYLQTEPDLSEDRRVLWVKEKEVGHGKG